MKKLIALVCLLAVFTVSAAAQTDPEPQPLCGIGHTDLTTGQFVCDDPPAGGQTDGIGHTDKTDPQDSLTVGAATLITVMAAILGLTRP